MVFIERRSVAVVKVRHPDFFRKLFISHEWNHESDITLIMIHFGFLAKVIDIETAFLYGDLKEESWDIACFIDGDYTDDPDTRRSISGFLLYILFLRDLRHRAAWPYKVQKASGWCYLNLWRSLCLYFNCWEAQKFQLSLQWLCMWIILV